MNSMKKISNDKRQMILCHIQFPCENCKKRKVGCHDDCKEYIKYANLAKQKRMAKYLYNNQ